MALAPETALVSGAVEALCARLVAEGAAAAEIDPIRLAVTEALTNAVVHGGAPAGTAEVRLRWNWAEGYLAVEVSEPGSFFPAPNWQELPEDPLSESGRGGFLIAQAFDDATHHNAGGRHILRMGKRLTAASAPTGGSELEMTLASMTEDLSASYETLAALFKLAETLATAEDLGTFVEHALAVRTLVDADWVHLRLSDRQGQLKLLASEGTGYRPTTLLPDGGNSVEAAVFREGLERTIYGGAALAAGDPLAGFRGTALVCPVSFQERRIGVAVLLRHRPDAHFTAAQVSLARTTADFLGIACANAEFREQREAQLRARRELEIARQIQQSLVPGRFPDHPDWRIAGCCHNALEVGGDFFDVVEVPGGILVAVADVMGKGVPAALLAVVLRTAVRAHAALAAEPGDLLDKVDAQVAPDLERLGMFITAAVVFAPTGSSELRFASAGHPPPLLLARTPERDRALDDGGLPLGIAPDERYATHRVRVAKGDRLILTTDGVLEAPSGDGEELGPSGTLAFARRAGGSAVDGLCQAVLELLRERDAGRPPSDDRTLVALECTR